MAVASYVDKFRDEFVAHLDGGGCPFDDSPLEGILAPIAQHAATRRRGARMTPHAVRSPRSAGRWTLGRSWLGAPGRRQLALTLA